MKWIVPIVSDAAIATGAVGDGRLIPLVILDTTNRPDLIDFFKAHDKMPPGDVDSAWASIEGFSDHLALWLKFKKPFETEAVFNFELMEHGLAVDLAMRGRAIYLQAGKPGDRLYREMDAPRIVVELGAEMPKQQWEEVWQKAIKNRLRKEGLSRKDSRRMSPEYMERVRSTMGHFRTAPSGVYIIPDEK